MGIKTRIIITIVAISIGSISLLGFFIYYFAKDSFTDQFLEISIGLAVAVLCVGMLIGWRINQSITRPITELLEAVKQVREGDKTRRAQVTSANEIGELAQAFNSMMDTINQNDKELDDRQARLKAVLDNTVDGLITINDMGTVESFNLACEDIFGFTAKEVVGKNVSVLMPEPYHGEHDGYLKNYRDTGEKKIIGIGREVKGQRKDGSTFPIDLSVSEVQVQGRRIFSGIVRDISERKDAEEKISLMMEDLRISNEELAKFTYVASHDLKSPLRAIDNITRWLEEDLEGRLDDTSKERMHKLRGRVMRMERLLDDLLAYSRAGRKIENPEMIAAARLIQEVEEFLNVPEGILVEADVSLNDVIIPRMPLEQIFQNLISNAVKHHDKENGRIVISVKDDDQAFTFSVADDGPGIPEEFQEKVFEMFQTLRPRDEVEGSGMGLALVRKTLYRHGGSISLESKEGWGTTFHFVWPKNPECQSQRKLEEERAA